MFVYQVEQRQAIMKNNYNIWQDKKIKSYFNKVFLYRFLSALTPCLWW